MINATEMAKPFGKVINNWRHLPSTERFLTAYLDSRKSTVVDNLIVTKKGNPESGGGTWMHEDIAIEFARWLSRKSCNKWNTLRVSK